MARSDGKGFEGLGGKWPRCRAVRREGLRSEMVRKEQPRSKIYGR